MAMIISAAELLLIRAEYSAKFAGNFAMKKRRGGREFKSNADKSSVSRLWNHAENCSKSARVRAICDHPWTRRARSSETTGSNGQFLSRRDLPRSSEHRLPFPRHFERLICRTALKLLAFSYSDFVLSAV